MRPAPLSCGCEIMGGKRCAEQEVNVREKVRLYSEIMDVREQLARPGLSEIQLYDLRSKLRRLEEDHEAAVQAMKDHRLAGDPDPKNNAPDGASAGGSEVGASSAQKITA